MPQARVTEFYGASEASYITWMDVADRPTPQTVGQPFGNVQLRIGPTPTAACRGRGGRIWLRSPMLFMDYVHALDGSAAELHDGWLTVRDMGWLDAARPALPVRARKPHAGHPGQKSLARRSRSLRC